MGTSMHGDAASGKTGAGLFGQDEQDELDVDSQKAGSV